MKVTKKRLKGFTLIEMIVVVALFFMMMMCVFSVLKPMQKVFKDTFEYNDAQAVGDIACRYIEDEVRYANRLYLYDKMEVADDETFIDGQVAKFRNDYLFGQADKKRISNSKEPDTVYVMKIDNPTGVDDPDSRGKISRWTYEKGVEVGSKYRDWAVQQDLYDDESRNTHYSFMFQMGTWEEDELKAAVSASNFTMTMSIYKHGRNSTTLGDTCLDHSIAFSLVNIAKGKSIISEDITYTDVPTATQTKALVSRYQYYDSSILSMTEGSDVYFIYTKVPKIEDIV